jgi:RNA polymerase sigma factor (TIGR02999 family)
MADTHEASDPAPREDPAPTEEQLPPTGRRHAAETLFPVLYDELRRLAEVRLGRERVGGTLQATALVHEAYLRIAGGTGDGSAQQWDGRGHFFAAAANAMRRILVERARSRGRLKRGGGRRRVELDSLVIGANDESVDIVALDEAMSRLQQKDARKHDVVMLRFFAGLSIDQVAEALHVATATVERDWNFSKAWLFREIADRSDEDGLPSDGSAGGIDGG